MQNEEDLTSISLGTTTRRQQSTTNLQSLTSATASYNDQTKGLLTANS